MNNQTSIRPRTRASTRLAAVALAAATLLASALSFSDVVRLSNGDRITGTVGTITGGQVTITTDYAGDVVIAMANVADIQASGNYDVTLASGDTVSGQLVADGVMVDGSVRPASIEDISMLAPVPGNEPIWTSRIDAFATFSNGNADTQTLSIIGDSMYTHGIRGRNEHRVTAFWGDEEAQGETTKEQIEIDYTYRRYLRNDWYAGANVEYFRDALKEVDSRWTVGLGLGKLFWDNALGRFSAEIGISQVFEDLAGDSESNPALRWAMGYNRFITPTMEFYHNNEILKILDSDRGEIYDSSTGFRFSMSDHLSVNLRADLRHETDPPEGAHRSDITYAVGVGYVF